MARRERGKGRGQEIDGKGGGVRRERGKGKGSGERGNRGRKGKRSEREIGYDRKEEGMG